MRKRPDAPPAEQPKKHFQRKAKRELFLWRKNLNRKGRSKLEMQMSPWGRDGGSIIKLGLRQGKTARRNKKLKREREARFKAEQAAYEARLILPAKIVKRTAPTGYDMSQGEPP
jgi:hypothetical protein